uniref:Peptidase domain containing associated with muscle reration 1 n=1 Tax=Cyclopterus lumpus TaxID=8103 RepID=A0A8C2WB63_CYCLU
MCRPCCEYHLIQCRCPSRGSGVGYTVPCCRNVLDECDPCIIHPGCSLFENCKSCNNGTWKANDDFFVDGKYCTECRPGWSGGDCRTCGGVIGRTQGHIAVESYPTNARCEWTVRVASGSTVELRFSLLSLESDHSCRYDYVEVRDGGDLSAPVIGRFCGDRPPPPVRSSGNLVHVLFASDGYNNLDGFVLAFQESPGRYKRRWLRTYRATAMQSRAPLSSVEHPACAPPEEPANGYSLPVHGPKEELVSVNYRCAEAVGFFCKNSYILSGNHQSTCLSNGSWSSRPPKCVRACREPKVSELVRQNQRLRLSSGNNVRDLLSDGFIPLVSVEPSNKDGGGDAFAELPRGLHPVRTSLEYTCASPLYRHTGSSRRTCLKSGRWSGRHVSCSPVCGKFDTPGPNNLTDTPWPWHAAVYVRSPPDRTHRPRGVTESVQQGASEESTFWRLACSGALLSRRSVLVAAQCVVDKDKQQTLHPTHVKVVMGAQRQTSKDRQRSLHAVSVHPDFFSAPDSDVAVLELKDKARIDERVRPVCLPAAPGGEVTAREAYASRWTLPNRSRDPTSRTSLAALVDVTRCEPARPRRPLFPVSFRASRPLSSPASDVLSGREETGGAAGTGWQLLGLESFSYKEEEEEDCHQRRYTVHTRIANFRDWIVKNTK